MDFNFQRHMRIGGSVVSVVGLFMSNWTLVGLGWMLVAISYTVSIGKIELYIESQNKEKDDAIYPAD